MASALYTLICGDYHPSSCAKPLRAKGLPSAPLRAKGLPSAPRTNRLPSAPALSKLAALICTPKASGSKSIVKSTPGKKTQEKKYSQVNAGFIKALEIAGGENSRGVYHWQGEIDSDRFAKQVVRVVGEIQATVNGKQVEASSAVR